MGRQRDLIAAEDPQSQIGPGKCMIGSSRFLLASTLAIILAAIGLQIAIDTFKRKKYEDSAPPKTVVGPRRPAH